MRRHGQYPDTGANQMPPSHMQHMTGQNQRMQQSPAMNNYMGQQDHVPTEEDRKYMASKPDSRWQWDDDDASKGLTVMSPHQFKDSQGSDASRYQGSRPDPNFGFGMQGGSKDPRDLPHDQDPRAPREDASLPRTLDGLEQKFLDEIMQLNKELQDAEDAELLRHRERVGEINTQFREKLLALRAHQSNHRDDFLHREMQARQQIYQQHPASKLPGSGQGDPHGYRQPPAAYAGGQFDASYRDQTQLLPGGAHNQGFEGRGSYPASSGGQGYNNSRSGGRFY